MNSFTFPFNGIILHILTFDCFQRTIFLVFSFEAAQNSVMVDGKEVNFIFRLLFQDQSQEYAA